MRAFHRCQDCGAPANGDGLPACFRLVIRRCSLSQLARSAGGSAARRHGLWSSGYDPGQERLREALCAVGSSYLGSPGCARIGGKRGHVRRAPMWPGCTSSSLTVEGCAGRQRKLSQLPNWLSLTFRNRWRSMVQRRYGRVDVYRQTFDLPPCHVDPQRDSERRRTVTTMTQERFVHEPANLVALQLRIESKIGRAQLISGH